MIGQVDPAKSDVAGKEETLRRRSRFRTILFLVFLVGAGLWLRTIRSNGSLAILAKWTYSSASITTLYFTDGSFLIPVSRTLNTTGNVALASLNALLDGPRAASGLSNPVPGGIVIRSFHLANGVAHIDLSKEFLAVANPSSQAVQAIISTMTAQPDIRSVVFSVEGSQLVPATPRIPLLYFASEIGLASIPVSAANPRALLDRYMAGPPVGKLAGLPADVKLLGYDYNTTKQMVSLNFSYTPSIRILALEQPARMRFVLLGLIATLTDQPSVQSVRIDFEGKTQLGVGQCSDLLRTPQTKPTLLNDERLLGR